MEETHTGKLIIVRHQESEWNKLGLWTGVHDTSLTPYGFKESEAAGKCIRDVSFNYAFASMYVRTIETLASILNVCLTDAEKKKVHIEHRAELNERDYGDYTGKNKWDMEKLLGEQAFVELRRAWDYPVPNGETLKMVYERVVPFYTANIVPLLQAGNNVLVVSHGNTIRALTKYIERISDAEIANVEMLFGQVVIYTTDTDGHMLTKQIRLIEDVKE